MLLSAKEFILKNSFSNTKFLTFTYFSQLEIVSLKLF